MADDGVDHTAMTGNDHPGRITTGRTVTGTDGVDGRGDASSKFLAGLTERKRFPAASGDEGLTALLELIIVDEIPHALTVRDIPADLDFSEPFVDHTLQVMVAGDGQAGVVGAPKVA